MHGANSLRTNTATKVEITRFCALRGLVAEAFWKLPSQRMNLDAIKALSPEKWRSSLPHLLAQNLTCESAREACGRELLALTSKWTDDDATVVLQDILHAGEEARLYPANHQCRELSRVWASHVLTSVEATGFEHLEAAMAAGPTVLFANHASYIDSPLLDAVIAQHDAALANRVVHIAGPKVYEALFRRVAIVCLNAIPVEQSAQVRSEEAPVRSMREMAKQVAKTLEAAEAALSENYTLLLYPEGSRTRDGRMRPFLPGASRYLKVPGTQIIPLSLVGAGEMMGLSGDLVTPKPFALRIGAPIPVTEAGGPRAALKAAELAVLQQLPETQLPLST